MDENKVAEKRWRVRVLTVAGILLVAIIAGLILVGSSGEREETITETMKDGVLHEANKISLFGLEVNPGFLSALIVSGVLLTAAIIIRIFVIPRFRTVPGRFQLALETLVGYFDGLAGSHSHEHKNFVGGYVFSAGVYVFVGTVFELFGVPAVTSKGLPITLPAPLADINGAIAMGVLSYLVILGAGLIFNGGRGVLGVLKDFSLPVSMSFRLFGALLSGLLVTELVYYYVSLSYVLPVVVGVLFTLLHALVQTYVLTMLVATFYGEAAETKPKKAKKPKAKKAKKAEADAAQA